MGFNNRLFTALISLSFWDKLCKIPIIISLIELSIKSLQCLLLLTIGSMSFNKNSISYYKS